MITMGSKVIKDKLDQVMTREAAVGKIATEYQNFDLEGKEVSLEDGAEPVYVYEAEDILRYAVKDNQPAVILNSLCLLIRKGIITPRELLHDVLNEWNAKRGYSDRFGIIEKSRFGISLALPYYKD